MHATTSRTAALLTSLALALAPSVGCAHVGLPPPRLVLAARLTTRPTGQEGVASASLAIPLDARVPRPEPAPATPEPVRLERGDTSISDVDLFTEPYRDEPSIEALLAAALASSRLDPSRARDARERARLSGLLPIVRADVRRGSGWDLRTQQGTSVDTAILGSDDSWSVVGSVTLRLDRLVFAHEETSLLSEERRLEEARLRLVSEIVRLYHERRRLQRERDRRGSTDLATEARIAELGAMIDALTDGGMSQRPR